MNDHTPMMNQVSFAPVFKKEIFECDGVTVVQRSLVRGEYTDWIQEFMGFVTVGVQLPNGQQTMMQREFPISGVVNVLEAFANFHEQLAARQKDMQAQIENELKQQAMNTPRIQPATKKNINFFKKPN